MKKESGITLIALIITIIVLLILAGVSISMVVGDNGILAQAGKAKSETRGALLQEKIEIYNAEINIASETDSEIETDIVKFVEELESEGIITEIEKEEILTTGSLTTSDEVYYFVKEGDWISYDAGVWTSDEIDELNNLNLYAGAEIQKNNKISNSRNVIKLWKCTKIFGFFSR